MFQWAVLITTVLGSLLCRRLFTHKQRMWILPFCIAYVLFLVTTVRTIDGFFHFAFMAFNFFVTVFLCNGFNRADTRNNPAWKSFMVFWVYMFVIVFTGYFPLDGACTYLKEFVNTFAAGYFFAMWICRTEGALKKSLVMVLVAAMLSIVYSAAHGGFDASLVDSSGRAGLDENTLAKGVIQNVNDIAIATSCLLPFLMVLLLKDFPGKCNKLLSIAAGITLVFVVLKIIRTGSRNGALALIPCVWYFFNASKRNGRMAKQIAQGVVMLVLVIIGVGITMRNADSLRAFDFLGKSQNDIADTGDRISTGRFDMYKNCISLMSPFERVIGKGLTLTDNVWSFDKASGQYIRMTKVNSGNAHSIYMTIFYRAGFIGVFLFICFIVVSIRQGLRLGDRGKMALLFMGVWLLTGVGEAWGMTGGCTATLAGIAMGLLTNQPVTNSELMERRDYELVRNARNYGWRR